MYKSKILSIIFILFTVVAFGQTRLPGAGSNSSSEGSSVDFSKERQLKEDITDIGLQVANKLMNCCSTFGGKNLYSNVDFDGVKQNTVSGAFTIPMTVGWYGSLSGNHYWIKGKLLVYSSGRKEWIKINDSGVGFSPQCSKDCIN